MNKQVLTIRHDVARDQATQLAEQNLIESTELYNNLFRLAFVLGYEFYGSNWVLPIQLNFKSWKEGQGKAVEGYLSGRYVFVYLWPRSELLRGTDRLDLSKKNRAVPALLEYFVGLSFFSTKK